VIDQPGYFYALYEVCHFPLHFPKVNTNHGFCRGFFIMALPLSLPQKHLGYIDQIWRESPSGIDSSPRSMATREHAP